MSSDRPELAKPSLQNFRLADARRGSFGSRCERFLFVLPAFLNLRALGFVQPEEVGGGILPGAGNLELMTTIVKQHETRGRGRK